MTSPWISRMAIEQIDISREAKGCCHTCGMICEDALRV